MIKFKRIIALTLVMIMGLTFVACGNDTSDVATPPVSEEKDTKDVSQSEPEVKAGKVLNIWGWNTEFQGLFKTYFEDAGLVPDGIEVKFTIVPNEDNAYQNALDEALLNQETASDDEKLICS